MKALEQLLENVKYDLINGSMDKNIHELIFDSRKAVEHSVFFAIVGFTADGHQFVKQAYSQGCRVFVVQENVDLPDDATILKVVDTSYVLGLMACNFYDNPSRKLKLIGITGTNGKTTTTSLLYKLFMELGFKSGLISTVVNKIGNNIIPSTHTTPNPVELNQLLDKMVKEGCAYCFMEVSSHAVHQHRIAGLEYKIGVFTNITHDHLDYHNTFAEYIRVKKAFFDGLGKGSFALVNSDDKNGLVMMQNTKASKRTFALKTPADFTITIPTGAKFFLDGIDVILTTIGGTVTAQAFVSAGITGTLSKFLAITQTTALTATQFNRQKYIIIINIKLIDSIFIQIKLIILHIIQCLLIFNYKF
jgi:UDP-N-acetylmuramoyl-L-alanyl-D-glutamate--2,6-diaminopimelate ligase